MGIQCCRYFSHMFDDQDFVSGSNEADKVLSRQEGQRRGSYKYLYPTDGMIEILVLDFLCYDDKSILCHFRDRAGNKVKLRMWPKSGYEPLCSAHSFIRGDIPVTGRAWLCAYGKMHHGYIELVCAIPVPDWLMPPQEPNDEENLSSSEEEIKFPLDSLIGNAEAKKGM